MALVIAAVAVVPAPLAAAHGTTLTVETDTTLKADLVGHIQIAANDIILNCKGHTVSGIGGGIGIDLIQRTEVTIKNCRVTGFSVGFRLLESHGNTLEKNTANGNVVHGFKLGSSSDNTLTKNTANGNTRGFELENTSGNTLTENVACGNGDVDALQVDSSGNVLLDNKFCTTSGI